MNTQTKTRRITANVVRDLALPRETTQVKGGHANTETQRLTNVGCIKVDGGVHRDEDDGEWIVGTEATLFTAGRPGTVATHATPLSSGNIAVSIGQSGYADDGRTFVSRQVGAHVSRADAIALRDAIDAALAESA